MCLGIPGKVVQIGPDGNTATIEVMGVRRTVNTFLVGVVELGEYLMVHTGFAIEKVDVAEAAERIKLWQEILAAGDAAWQETEPRPR
ncbi:MAG: HypC/HybG/HupF family hydrogenase formation chaperone [Thermoanaerobacterales bacterium]|nr:HypC/HybG/HupF family hydrogenase formation chaperone [Bacillota bacterium]MDI6908071.1 HypC/HybG/HupF family hydrogenase formation chaperone [Thermoanaerobacterales bacterium]